MEEAEQAKVRDDLGAALRVMRSVLAPASWPKGMVAACDGAPLRTEDLEYERLGPFADPAAFTDYCLIRL